MFQLKKYIIQSLNLLNSGPVCHRKIPSVHTLNVTAPYNQTDGKLVPAYPEFSNVWPEVAPSQLKYTIRQVRPGKCNRLSLQYVFSLLKFKLKFRLYSIKCAGFKPTSHEVVRPLTK